MQNFIQFFSPISFIYKNFQAIMKKCLICKKELTKEERDFCETCKTFFEWKYRRSNDLPFKRLKRYFSKNLKLIKFWRKK